MPFTPPLLESVTVLVPDSILARIAPSSAAEAQAQPHSAGATSFSLNLAGGVTLYLLSSSAVPPPRVLTSASPRLEAEDEYDDDNFHDADSKDRYAALRGGGDPLASASVVVVVDWALRTRDMAHLHCLRERVLDYGTGVVYLDPVASEAQGGGSANGSHGGVLVSYPEHGAHLEWKREIDVYPGEVPVLTVPISATEAGPISSSHNSSSVLGVSISSIEVRIRIHPERTRSEWRPPFIRETLAALLEPNEGDKGLFERGTKGQEGELWEWEVGTLRGQAGRGDDGADNVRIRVVGVPGEKGEIEDTEIRVELKVTAHGIVEVFPLVEKGALCLDRLGLRENTTAA
ncbi:hypothetical protein BX600DRAFT_464754 [Xylariales sp. PMI_506]|nr:hypothetical protein BX600DRAFT_464754 [Xylariales sp. PMI_506]